jgi:hypothetical protein
MTQHNIDLIFLKKFFRKMVADGGKWWQMVANGGKWWQKMKIFIFGLIFQILEFFENGGKMVAMVAQMVAMVAQMVAKYKYK